MVRWRHWGWSQHAIWLVRAIVVLHNKGDAFLRRCMQISSAFRTAWPAEVFGDLDFNIAKIAFSRVTFPLLLIRIKTFWSARRTAFEAAIPVVAHERFSFVLLSRSVRVYIVDMGEIGLKLILGQSQSALHIEQPLTPNLKIGWVRYELHSSEVASTFRRSVRCLVSGCFRKCSRHFLPLLLLTTSSQGGAVQPCAHHCAIAIDIPCLIVVAGRGIDSRRTALKSTEAGTNGVSWHRLCCMLGSSSRWGIAILRRREKLSTVQGRIRKSIDRVGVEIVSMKTRVERRWIAIDWDSVKVDSVLLQTMAAGCIHRKVD